jgi:hypothetical protein
MTRKPARRLLLGVAVIGLAVSGVGLSAGSAQAADCTKKTMSVSDPNTGQSWSSVYTCGNTGGAALYLGSNPANVIGWMDSTTSWFVCYARGAQHSGGNNIWYYTQGDRYASGYSARNKWGYMPAVNLTTTTDPNPGVPMCDPDMWQAQESHTDFTGRSFNTVWYAGNTGGAALYAGASGTTTIGWMDSTVSWFTCYKRGTVHAGGNDVWYYTQGDRYATGQASRNKWGFMPAVSVATRSDPYDGIPACPSGTGSGTPTTTTTTQPSTSGTYNSTISRTEIINRAKDWYNKRGSIPYDTENDRYPLYPDVDGDHRYGMDCSGFVSMAWHIAVGTIGGRNTRTLPGVATAISRSSLQPGDMLDNTTDGHVILFAKWDDTSHTKFSYYSFGDTPIVYVTGASFGNYSLSGWPTSHYQAYRYNKVA